MFDCPLHGAECVFQVVVHFSNPIGGEPASSGCNLWLRTGEGLSDLTLDPSIHVQELDENGGRKTHWHGHVCKGMAVLA